MKANKTDLLLPSARGSAFRVLSQVSCSQSVPDSYNVVLRLPLDEEIADQQMDESFKFFFGKKHSHSSTFTRIIDQFCILCFPSGMETEMFHKSY